MELHIVHPDPKYAAARLIPPAPYGYIHLAACVAPPRGPRPIPGRSAAREALLTRLKVLAGELQTRDAVVQVTVYRAALLPPPSNRPPAPGTGPISASFVPPAALDDTVAPPGRKTARFDVAVLITAASPEAIPGVQVSDSYRRLEEAVRAVAREVYAVPARCVKRIGDVDQSRQGLFLFNHFATANREVALQLWEHLAQWYVVETGLDNSVVLQPLAEGPYAFVNHARWDFGLPTLIRRQFAKRSFSNYVLANLHAHGTVAMPALYRLA